MYPAILAAVRAAVWCIRPEKLGEIVAFLDSRNRGIQVDGATFAAVAAQTRERQQPSVTRSVAVLPIVGTITHRAGLIEESSGMVSVENVSQQFRRLVAAEDIGAIILDVDSPGGTVSGVPELAAEILTARNAKPIVAVANAMAGSAAYWIGSAAAELVVTPSGEVGSVGAYAVHWDESGLNETLGIKPTYIASSPYKIEGNPDAPLDDDAKAELQRRVDEVGEMFIRAVARQRGVTAAKVRETYGQGRMVGAEDAVRRGMADRVGTLQETIARLAGTGKGSRGKRVAALRNDLELRELGY